MKERVIGVESVDDSDKIIKDYIVKKIINGEIENITISNDTLKFQELLRKYHDYLSNKKGELLKELNPKKMVSNLKTNVSVAYLIAVSVAILYCLFGPSSTFVLRVVGFSSMGLGGALMSYFAYLDKKCDNPKATRELKKIEEELKKYEKIFEKSKMALLERETINKRNSVKNEKQTNKEKEREENISSKRKFESDKPSFMKNFHYTKNSRIFYENGFNLNNFSSEPLRYKPSNMGQFAHAHKVEQKETINYTSRYPDNKKNDTNSSPSRFSSRYEGERVKREFTPDRPTFINEEFYKKRATQVPYEEKESFKKR